MHKITLGAWYPRTTLHLSEIYTFLHEGTSELNLTREKLNEYHRILQLRAVSQETNYLEYIHAFTNNGIEIKYYEDGLYTLEIKTKDIEKGEKSLKEYFNSLNSAFSYLFSLGAPTPKVLANMPAHHPTVIAIEEKQWKNFKFDLKIYGEIYTQVKADEIIVYKTKDYIFIVYSHHTEKMVENLIEMQIFFREFKDQLKRYLNIHRTIWEEISAIKEQKTISADEIGLVRSKLDAYQKTINLVSNRINQMNTYISTRSKVAADVAVEKYLLTLFQYKFEVLTDTHKYIQEIWKMTTDYVNSAIQIINEIQNQSTQRSIQSLQLITLANVISTLLTKMALDQIPGVTSLGIIYVVIIVLVAWVINYSVIKLFKRVKYKIKFPETASL